MAKQKHETKVTIETTKVTTVFLEDADIEQMLRDKYGPECEVHFDISSGGYLRGCAVTKVEKITSDG